MQTPIERVAALTIGTVESVSPSAIQVLLEIDAPQTTALNTGAPTGFPRINGYVLIPNETGAVVGMIVELRVERSTFPKRTGMKDFGLIDLPFPLRKLTLTPLGTLIQKKEEGAETYCYKFERGVAAFPCVGDPVLLPTVVQLKSIITAAAPTDRRVAIGTSPLAADAQVTVDPDKIFGRHLAVLGNTGSGKSCSVAGLIRWSLEKAREERQRQGRNNMVNARFIILDPNGEYSSAFADLSDVRRFRVPPVGNGFRELVLPAWMWNSQEWSAFTQAKPGVQKPILMRALRELRAIDIAKESHSEVALYLSLQNYYRSLVTDKSKGTTAYMDFPGKQNFGEKIHAIAGSIADFSKRYSKYEEPLHELYSELKKIADQRGPDVRGFYKAFETPDVEDAIEAIDKTLEYIPAPPDNLGINEDCPIPFKGQELPIRIKDLAYEQGQVQYVDSLLFRIEMLLSDERLKPVVSPATDVALSQWLDDFIGKNLADDGCISIIDLSLISSDILHTVIAVVARIVFEAVQRYRRIEEKELPTVLVLEEAHTFIYRGSDQEEGNPTPAQMCRQTFERIAREGRKFGLGLVLSSQRPSELSPTVLAQCNTFLLHRIVNDRDQELVGKLVPDNLSGLLKELPSLPSRQAILLGWAASVPTLVEITKLPKKQRPESPDPEFWKVWTGEKDRPIDWKKIADNWTHVANQTGNPPTSTGKTDDEVPF
jgi:DNA helicase HerA-like ATPase